MKVPRYRVATCDGFAIKGMGTARRANARGPGLSATVCDTLYNWRVVKTYRSEDRTVRAGENATRGRDGALRDAEDHAAYLNAIHRRALHRDAVRAGRAEARARG